MINWSKADHFSFFSKTLGIYYMFLEENLKMIDSDHFVFDVFLNAWGYFEQSQFEILKLNRMSRFQKPKCKWCVHPTNYWGEIWLGKNIYLFQKLPKFCVDWITRRFVAQLSCSFGPSIGPQSFLQSNFIKSGNVEFFWQNGG